MSFCARCGRLGALVGVPPITRKTRVLGARPLTLGCRDAYVSTVIGFAGEPVDESSNLASLLRRRRQKAAAGFDACITSSRSNSHLHHQRKASCRGTFDPGSRSPKGPRLKGEVT